MASHQCRKVRRREAIGKILTSEAHAHRLRRPDEAVLIARGVEVDTNDDTARIYPRCITESDGSGWVERREHAIAQQKRVKDVCTVSVGPYDVALGVIPSSKRERSAGEINGGERPVVQQVSVGHSTAIPVSTDDRTGRVNRAGSAADGSGRIEAGESAFLGDYKAVVSARVAGTAAGRVGTVKSRHFPRRVDTREVGSRCAWEVNSCVFSPVQNKTVGNVTRVVVPAHDGFLRTDEVGSCECGTRRVKRCEYAFLG